MLNGRKKTLTLENGRFGSFAQNGSSTVKVLQRPSKNEPSNVISSLLASLLRFLGQNANSERENGRKKEKIEKKEP